MHSLSHIRFFIQLHNIFGVTNFYNYCVHSPGHEKRIVGEGMPLVEDPAQRGDLVVKFQIKFPSTLDPRQKLLIKQALA